MKTVLLMVFVLIAAIAGLSQAAATHPSATVSAATSKLGRILVDK